MSKYHRTKGANFEREIANLLTAALGVKISRNLAQSRGGEQEGSDLTIGPFSIECKRRAKLSLYEWLDQATRDAGGKVPVVVARGDGKRAVAVLWLDDAIPLIGGEL